MEKVDTSSSSRSHFQRSSATIFKLLFTLMVILACVFILGYVLGCRAEIVLSGSMEPTINAGGLIVTRPISPEDIQAGDILTYTSASGREIICHRVVFVEENPLRFFTQGDANKSPDPIPASPPQIIGIFCFQAPYLGYLLHFIRSPPILLGVITVFAAFIAVSERTGSWKSRK
jgi:signal peptidase